MDTSMDAVEASSQTSSGEPSNNLWGTLLVAYTVSGTLSNNCYTFCHTFYLLWYGATTCHSYNVGFYNVGFISPGTECVFISFRLGVVCLLPLCNGRASSNMFFYSYITVPKASTKHLEFLMHQKQKEEKQQIIAVSTCTQCLLHTLQYMYIAAFICLIQYQ